jgi:hypothetical protein
VTRGVARRRPSDQPVNCNGGGDLIIDLKNGGELTYGPCRWPWQISELWSAMIEVSDVTESNLILPNTPALAEEEQVRQALAVAIQRSRIRRKARFAPRTITCRPALTTPRGAPIGYRCAVALHSETTATGLKHMVVCAELSAGRLIYAPVRRNELCREHR